MKRILIIVFLLFHLKSFTQVSKVDSTENIIGQRIDSVLLVNKIDRNSTISIFENYLKDNGFISNYDSIAQGYINFYEYIKCPTCKSYSIKNNYQEVLKSFGKLTHLNFTILRQFQIPKNQYNSLEETEPLRDFVKFSKNCLNVGDIVPFNFELYESEYYKDIYKVVLLGVFSSFYHIEYVIKGDKLFATTFTDKMPSHKKGSQFFRENLKVKIKYNKKLLNEQGYNSIFSIKDNEDNLIKIETKNQVLVYFIVHKDGHTSDYHIANSSNEKLNKLAIKHLKKIGDWNPAEYKGENVDCLFFGHLLFYSDSNIKN